MNIVLRRLANVPLLHNFLSFSAIQAAQIVLPLLALPWLARALGPDAFGRLMYMLTVSLLVGLIMDWGFHLGAVRDAATKRTDPHALALLMREVLSAKILLALACILLAAGLWPVLLSWTPYNAPYDYTLAIAAGIVRGINPTWFFQGTGQGIVRMAAWDTGSSVLVLLGSLLCVRGPADGLWYLVLLVLCKGAPYVWLYGCLLRTYPARGYSLRTGWQALMRTRILFGSVLASILYSSGAQMLMGAFLPPRDMGILIVSDKIVRAVVSLMGPITQTLFPEICADKEKAPRLLRLSLLWTVGLMLCAAVGMALCAPLIITLALGPAYADAVPVLRLLCLLIPPLACNFVLGTQTLVSFGHERALTKSQALIACCSLPLAAALAHWGGLLGAACLPVMIEYSLCALLWCSIIRLCPRAFVCKSQ